MKEVTIDLPLHTLVRLIEQPTHMESLLKILQNQWFSITNKSEVVRLLRIDAICAARWIFLFLKNRYFSWILANQRMRESWKTSASPSAHSWCTQLQAYDAFFCTTDPCLSNMVHYAARRRSRRFNVTERMVSEASEANGELRIEVLFSINASETQATISRTTYFKLSAMHVCNNVR